MMSRPTSMDYPATIRQISSTPLSIAKLGGFCQSCPSCLTRLLRGRSPKRAWTRWQVMLWRTQVESNGKEQQKRILDVGLSVLVSLPYMCCLWLSVLCVRGRRRESPSCEGVCSVWNRMALCLEWGQIFSRT